MENDVIMGGITGGVDNLATPIDQMKEKLARENEIPEPKNTLPPELLNLSKEQVQAFKRLLEVTPDQPERERNRNPLIRLREIDGKIVVDFKDRVYPLRVRDENDKEVERLHIDIKFRNDAEFKPYPYKDFINSKQVPCEAIKVEHSTREVITGETMSRETGRLVDMVQTFVTTRFTLKLPTGEVVEIEGRVANA